MIAETLKYRYGTKKFNHDDSIKNAFGHARHHSVHFRDNGPSVLLLLVGLHLSNHLRRIRFGRRVRVILCPGRQCHRCGVATCSLLNVNQGSALGKGFHGFPFVATRHMPPSRVSTSTLVAGRRSGWLPGSWGAALRVQHCRLCLRLGSNGWDARHIPSEVSRKNENRKWRQQGQHAVQAKTTRRWHSVLSSDASVSIRGMSRIT